MTRSYDETVFELEEILTTELFSGSKDWVAGDIVDRVQWLLDMYKWSKEENEMLLDQLFQQNNIK